MLLRLNRSRWGNSTNEILVLYSRTISDWNGKPNSTYFASEFWLFDFVMDAWHSTTTSLLRQSTPFGNLLSSLYVVCDVTYIWCIQIARVNLNREKFWPKHIYLSMINFVNEFHLRNLFQSCCVQYDKVVVTAPFLFPSTAYIVDPNQILCVHRKHKTIFIWTSFNLVRHCGKRSQRKHS